MTKIIRMLSAAAFAGGLTLSLAAVANAQDAPPPPPGVQAGAHHWDSAKMREHMEERHQRRQQMLHDALGLRPDQDGAWQAFIAASGRPDGDRGPGMRHHDGDGQRAELTTPERLDRMAKRMAERQARFAQHADAVKRLYAALDARQQKTFDAVVMSRMGHGGMGEGHGRGWGGHGGDGHMGPPGGSPPAGERG